MHMVYSVIWLLSSVMDTSGAREARSKTIRFIDSGVQVLYVLICNKQYLQSAEHLGLRVIEADGFSYKNLGFRELPVVLTYNLDGTFKTISVSPYTSSLLPVQTRIVRNIIINRSDGSTSTANCIVSHGPCYIEYNDRNQSVVSLITSRKCGPLVYFEVWYPLEEDNKSIAGRPKNLLEAKYLLPLYGFAISLGVTSEFIELAIWQSE